MAWRKPDHNHRQNWSHVFPPTADGIFTDIWQLGNFSEHLLMLAGFFGCTNLLAKPMSEVATCHRRESFMLDTPSNTISDVRLQSFSIAYECPVIFTRNTFDSANRCLLDALAPPDAVDAFKQGRADGEWRIHSHVPLFLSDLGTIGSTRADLETVLAAFRQKSHSSHLEAENYTWDVLPDHLRTGSKAADIAREIAFCKKELIG